MPKIRLFCAESLEEKKEIDIDGDNFHYLVNVTIHFQTAVHFNSANIRKIVSV